MHRKYLPLLSWTPAIIAADQAVKLYVDARMHLYQSIEVMENFFHITYVRNRGAAFGILSNAHDTLRLPFFLLVSLLAVAVILYTLATYRQGGRLFPTALALVLGGALGNMIDRIRLGEVIDFIDVHWYQYHWPAFNVADSAITIGVGLLALHVLFDKENA